MCALLSELNFLLDANDADVRRAIPIYRHKFGIRSLNCISEIRTMSSQDQSCLNDKLSNYLAKRDLPRKDCAFRVSSDSI